MAIKPPPLPQRHLLKYWRDSWVIVDTWKIAGDLRGREILAIVKHFMNYAEAVIYTDALNGLAP